MPGTAPLQIDSIAAYHRLVGLPAPEHPLVSVVRFEDIRRNGRKPPSGIVNGFYSIALKRNFNARLRYGQQDIDFDAGVLLFIAPGQVITTHGAEEADFRHTGWLLMLHPDLLWNTALARKIGRYEFFGYQVNEALHLSDKEEQVLVATLQQITHEYRGNLDRFSKDVIIAHVELLLTYAERFYQRQFITREKAHHDVLIRLDELLTACFREETPGERGIPTVAYVADALHLSPNYLSRLLSGLTGRTTQQFIHDKLIGLAKERLSTTRLSVTEIAYGLGFEHPQSFSKLFKAKTEVSPLEFRQSFN